MRACRRTWAIPLFVFGAYSVGWGGALPDWVVRDEGNTPGRLGQEREHAVDQEPFFTMGEKEKTLLLAGEYWDEVVRLEKLVAAFERKLGPNLEDEEAAKALFLLGDALERTDCASRAAQAFARAEAIMGRIYGQQNTHILLAENFSKEGMSLLSKGHGKAAADVLRRAIRSMQSNASMETAEMTGEVLDALVRAILMQEFPDVQGSPLAVLGHAEMKAYDAASNEINRISWHYFAKGFPFVGDAVLKKALKEGLTKGLSEEAPQRLVEAVCSTYRFNLAFLNLSVLGGYKNAATELDQVVAVRSKALGPTHAGTTQAVVSLGWARALTRDTAGAGIPEAAEPLLRQALDIAERPFHVSTYSHVAITQHMNMLRGWGDKGRKNADSFMKEYTSLSKTIGLSKNHSLVVSAREQLAAVLMAQAQEPDFCPGEGQECPLGLTDEDRAILRTEALAL